MSDYAHKYTDKEIEAIEERLAKEYKRAEREIQQKLDDYMDGYRKRDEAMRRKRDAGEISDKDYKNWRTGQLAVGKRWEDQKTVIAHDFANVNEIARNIAYGHRPEVYAVNFNYGTFQVEKGAKVDTHFTLYNKQAVERLFRDNPKLLPDPGKKTENRIYNGLEVRWNRQQLQSVMMQGIVQGESIPKLAERLAKEVGEKNHHAAVRNARTMMTSAQNAGRLDSFRRAMAMGIPVQKCWTATHDGRTRHWHLDLDGEVAELEEPFVNDYGEIMYPGDPGAEPANVYNCRCRLVPQIKGHETDTKAYRASGDTAEYKKWERDHQKSQPKGTPLKSFLAASSGGSIRGDVGGVLTQTDLDAMEHMLRAADADVQKIWDLASGDFQEPMQYVDDPNAAFYSIADDPVHHKEANRVYLNPSDLTRVRDFHEKFDTYFHEFMHNADFVLGRSTIEGTISESYRRADGKTFEQIIMDEWRTKLSSGKWREEALINQFSLQYGYGGMGGANYAYNELTNWRQLNRLPRSDQRYLSIRQALHGAGNDRAALEKVLRSNVDVFSTTLTDDDVIKYSLPRYCDTMRNGYTSSERGILSDILEKFSQENGGKDRPLGFGHGILVINGQPSPLGTKYMSTKGALAHEAFAEMGEAEISNHGALALIKQELPDSYAAYRDMIRGIK